MPGMNGFSVCREIRKNSDVPIIFITARVLDEDKINGCFLGADDYVTKPFSLPVLHAKAKRVWYQSITNSYLWLGEEFMKHNVVIWKKRRPKMAVFREMVLYYHPDTSDKTRLLKGVLVRMGIRIKNIAPSQINETVGTLAGLPGFRAENALEVQEKETEALPFIPEEMLVLHGFSSRRLDELLGQLRKAKVPPIALKAVLTESNCKWSFYELYQEIKAEHEKMKST